MPAIISHIEFGHPKFWKNVHDAYPRFFEVHPRLVTSFNSIAAKPRPHLNREQKVITNLAQLAGVAMAELVTLAGNGFGTGAMKIARNVLEVSINADYLRVHPDAVNDFLEWFWVEQHRVLTYARQHDPDLLKQFTPEAVQKVEQEFARVHSRFEKPHNPKEIRSSWCTVDLGTRAVQAHMERAYRLINPFGTQFMHGTLAGMLNHFDLSISSEQIAAPPSLKWCPQALCSGHNCLAMVIHTLELLFGEEAQPSSDHVAQDFEYAWPASFADAAGV